MYGFGSYSTGSGVVIRQRTGRSRWPKARRPNRPFPLAFEVMQAASVRS